MDKIQFTVNGLSYSLAGSEVTPMTSLNDYLRNYLQLFGTKAMCHEGGCGACVVSVARTNARSSEKEVLAVNSCLVHILSCHQWDITTVEGIGNRKEGYHAVQQRLADFNGTQCGYCTPGMVMNMYSLHKTNSNLTMKEVENSFGSNICRCTGYRPILDAFKSFATNLDPALESKIQDVEDLHQLKCRKVCGGKQDCKEDDWCIIANDEEVLREVSLPSGSWYKAYTIGDVFKIFTRIGTKSYRFVAGNTGQGIYPIETQPTIFIDISSIASMMNCLPDENLIIGAGMSLTELMSTFQAWSKKSEFKYLDELYKHLDLVAHIPVRNVGTIAGNLALKNMHNDFPSDVFLILTTVGAYVTLVNGKQVKSALKMQDFVKSDLKNTLILDVRLPPMSETNLLKTYKIMPRAQNAHAIVNAGFLFKLDGKRVTSANIIFGNISPAFVAATETEKALVGEELFSDGTLQKALESLKIEVVPVEAPPEPSADCRKVLALGLFYKCLVHILSCHQWDITTVEGIGNRKEGYHAVQQRLADFNGTQCGYCTPGMVMNMYSLHKTNSNLTMKEVENSFGSNICRCTGYRPILDAFKSFATNLDPALESKIQDVEDLDQLKCRKVCGGKQDCKEDDWCIIANDEEVLREVSLPSGSWYKAYTIGDVFKIFTRIGTKSYRFVAGNTGQGIYPIETQPEVFIDISSIASMMNCLPDENLIIGAGMSLTELMSTFQAWSKKSEFKYLDELHKHLDLVAHIPIRNVGTIAGNLALKNMHNDFPSDVFLILITVGAYVTLVNGNQVKSALKMQDFVKSDLKNTLILDVRLPPMSETNLLKTYKIMPRAQNAHAIVNAGFLFKLDGKRVTSANIIFGNISPAFVAATETEKALVGEELFSDGTLQKALESLKIEVVPVEAPPEPSADCRKMLALGLFYKAILSLSPTLNPRYKSGGSILQRELSKGTQTFDTDKSLWPLNKPVKKLEALTQCSGEVDYACDVTLEPSAVQVAFVLSTICKGEIENIDASDALKIPGVIAFYSAKDIPGKNSFTSKDVPWIGENEEILATAVVYYGQPIGVIAAVTRKLALSAVELVKVKYKKSSDKLILQVRDALDAPDKERRVRRECKTTPKERGKDVTKTIQGRYHMPSQYHYTMEPQSCTVINNSRGIVVRSATQWMDLVNAAVGDALGIDHNRVEVVVPRIGGGYGGKGSRSSLIACACAVVAYKLNRTATLVLPIKDNMAAVGMRQECEMDYEIGINDAGLIQFLNITYYSDCGSSFNDGSGDISWVFESLYDTSRWKIEGYSVLTDKVSMTWCRAPGTTEAIALTEHIMERIAFETKKDPVDIRLMHIKAENNAMKDLVATFKRDCEFDARQEELKKFNEENAWKKKALKLSIMAYPILYSWNFPVTVSIHHSDGTVSMAHGGIEMGQGINTKVAQVCAYKLKIPLEKITVRPSDSYTSPNSMVSNGSITSDCVAFATVKACEELLRRLEVVKQGLENPTWLDVVRAAYNKGIDLKASYMASPSDNLQNYTVYGVCAAEVELDVLTGNHQLRRVDLLEDTGVSISPDIDVGQIEGAFVMGLGLWTSEHLIYNEEGKLLTDRTWTYKPPGAKDIPADFRVSFRRNSPNPAGVLRSKATGEPAITLAVVVTFALHDAVVEARKEFGYNDMEWLNLESPCNVEHILKAISPKTAYYKIN